MKKLLRLKDHCRWELEGITFAINERIGEPEDFIGRVEELVSCCGKPGVRTHLPSHVTVFCRLIRIKNRNASLTD